MHTPHFTPRGARRESEIARLDAEQTAAFAAIRGAMEHANEITHLLVQAQVLEMFPTATHILLFLDEDERDCFFISAITDAAGVVLADVMDERVAAIGVDLYEIDGDEITWEIT